MQKKLVLITGVAGFIGSNLAAKLLDLDFQVVGIDNFLNNYDVSIKKRNVKALEKKSGFKFYKGSILDIKVLEDIFSLHKFDTVIHLAARAGIRPSLLSPQEYFDTNVVGTINVLEQIRKKSVKQLIFASSSSVYGNKVKVPFLETHSTDHPVSPYGASKKSAEVICKTYAHLYNIQTTVFRFFSVYGTAGRPDMAPYIFAQSILKNKPIHKFGDSIQRDYTHIDDIVNGIIAGIYKPFLFEIINLGNSSPVSLEKLISIFEKIFSKEALVSVEKKVSGDVDITYANVNKAKKLLGWEPLIGIDQGLKLFAEWIKAQK